MLLALSAALLATIGMVWIYQHQKTEIYKIPGLSDVMKQLHIKLPKSITVTPDAQRDFRKKNKNMKTIYASSEKVIEESTLGYVKRGGVPISPGLTTPLNFWRKSYVQNPWIVQKPSSTPLLITPGVSLTPNVQISQGVPRPTRVLISSDVLFKPHRVQTLSALTPTVPSVPPSLSIPSSMSVPSSVSVPLDVSVSIGAYIPASELLPLDVSMPPDVQILKNSVRLPAAEGNSEQEKFRLRLPDNSTSTKENSNSTSSI